MKDKSLTNIIGVIFLLFGITAIINTSFEYGIKYILWFCYLGLIILGIGFLSRSKTIIESQINILAIPLLIWTFDFIYYLIFGHSLLNIVGYFFEKGPLLSKIITTQHIFTIPLAIYARKFIKSKSKNPWIFSFIQISIIFVISRIISNYVDNLNWVYNTSLNLNIQYYPVFWFLFMFTMIIITNKIIKEVHN